MSGSRDKKPIFYLELAKYLPDHFVHMSIHFSDLGYQLVPISPQYLDQLLAPQNNYIVVVVTSLEELERYNQIKKRFLDLSLLSGKVKLIEATSFSPTPMDQRIHKRKSFSFIRLPRPAETLCRMIYKFVEDDVRNANKWPGGNRARLPKDISDGR